MIVNGEKIRADKHNAAIKRNYALLCKLFSSGMGLREAGHITKPAVDGQRQRQFLAISENSHLANQLDPRFIVISDLSNHDIAFLLSGSLNMARSSGKGYDCHEY